MLLSSPDIEGHWQNLGGDNIADAMPQIADYPTAAVARGGCLSGYGGGLRLGFGLGNVCEHALSALTGILRKPWRASWPRCRHPALVSRVENMLTIFATPVRFAQFV